jgi:hypothetical protein
VFDTTIEVPVTIRNPDKPLGTHVFIAMARHPAGCARSHRADCIAAILDHRLGRAAEPRDQLSHRVRRGAQQPAPGRLLDAPAYGRCPRCERQLLGQRRLRLLFPGQLELATCQYASARRPILSTDATALVVRRGTPRVGRMVAQGHDRFRAAARCRLSLGSGLPKTAGVYDGVDAPDGIDAPKWRC